MNVKDVDRTVEHVAYEEWLRDDADGNPIYTSVECGSWHRGATALCDDCAEDMIERYPQGWAYYPGDTCMHGVYVGGSGIDWMCHDCEMGYTHWVDEPTYELVMTVGKLSEPIKLARYTGEPDMLWYSGRVKTTIKAASHPDALAALNPQYEWVQRAAGYWDVPPSEDTDG